MKKECTPKQFVVRLNYDFLLNQLKNNKVTCFNEKIDDNDILLKFNLFKGTKQALNLLGTILSNIENSLEITIFVGKDNYPLTGEILYKNNSCCIYGDGYEVDDPMILDIINENRAAIMNEAKDTVKYYKEYFIRIYDRSKTA